MKIHISRKVVRDYCFRVVLAFDIMVNVLLGGDIDQTFCARNYHWKKTGKPNIVWFIDLLIFWDQHHCMYSWIWWRYRVNLRKIGRHNVHYIKR